MKLGLINREAIRAISPLLEAEFDSLMATIGATFLREHTWDGLHGDIHADSITQNANTDQNTSPAASKIGNITREESGHWWLQGPWLFDDPNSATPLVARIRDDPAAGTYNNYAPAGIDSAVILELEPAGAVTITGIRQSRGIGRLLAIRNRDSSNTVTLKHANAGSSVQNQFSLPDSTDIELGPGQMAWMYYDIGREAWALFVTTHQSGGLASSSAVIVAELAITEAQLEALSVTPLTVVAAAGSGTIIVVLHWAYQIDVATAYSNAPSVRLRYAGSTDNLANTIGSRASSLDISHATAIAQAFAQGEATFDPRNKAVTVELDAALTGAGVATAKLRVAYYVVTGY